MLGDRIKASKQENLQSIDELDALYITFEDEKSIKVDGRSVDDFSSRIKFIEAIREKNYEVERIGYSNKYNLFNKLKENHDYIDKVHIIV